MSGIADIVDESSFQGEVDQAKTLLQSGCPKPALEIGLRLQLEWPDNPESWRVLGSARADLDQDLEGIAAFEKVVELDPSDINAHLILGLLNERRGNVAGAISWFSKLLKLDPHHTIAVQQFGHFIDRIQKLGPLTKDIRKALHQLAIVYQKLLDADDIITTSTHYFQLFAVYFLLDDISSAKMTIESAMKLDYDRNLALQNYGTLLRALGADSEAESCYRDAIALDQSRGEYFYALAELILKKLDFKNGLRLYESRWDDRGFNNPRLKTERPIWTGTSANHLLIWPEQGIGDAIMMMGLLPLAAEKCRNITVLCDQRLIKLFERSAPKNVNFESASAFLEAGGKLDIRAFDEHIPLMSLPLALDFNQELLMRGRKQKVLKAAKKQSVYEEIVEKNLHHQKMIGISWRTLSQATTNRFRNIDIVDLVAPLVGAESVIVSLQYGDVSAELERVKAELDIDIITLNSLDTSYDIDGLAYLISLCRHVVTIDNSTVHLAGSLGVSTHLLVPLFSDWRWGLRDSQLSYWYDSVKLHWQDEASNWSDPMMAVSKELMEAELCKKVHSK